MVRKLSIFQIFAVLLVTTLSIVSMFLDLIIDKNVLLISAIVVPISIIFIVLFGLIFIKKKQIISFASLILLGTFLLFYGNSQNFVYLILGGAIAACGLIFLLLNFFTKINVKSLCNISTVISCIVPFFLLYNLTLGLYRGFSILGPSLFILAVLICCLKDKYTKIAVASAFLVASLCTYIFSIIEYPTHYSSGILTLLIYTLIPLIIIILTILNFNKVVAIIAAVLTIFSFVVAPYLLPLFIAIPFKKSGLKRFILSLLGPVALVIIWAVLLPMNAGGGNDITHMCVLSVACVFPLLNTTNNFLHDKESCESERESNELNKSFTLDNFILLFIPLVIAVGLFLITEYTAHGSFSYYIIAEISEVIPIAVIFIMFIISRLFLLKKYEEKYKVFAGLFLLILPLITFYIIPPAPGTRTILFNSIKTSIVILSAGLLMIIQFFVPTKKLGIFSALSIFLFILSRFNIFNLLYYDIRSSIILVLSLIALIAAILIERKEIIYGVLLLQLFSYSIIIYEPYTLYELEDVLYIVLVAAIFASVVESHPPYFGFKEKIKEALEAKPVENEDIKETGPAVVKETKTKNATVKHKEVRQKVKLVPVYNKFNTVKNPYPNTSNSNNFVYVAPVKKMVIMSIKFMLLNVITLGLYSIFGLKDFLEEVTQDLYHPQGLQIHFTFTGTDLFVRTLIDTLLITVTFGIYAIFWPHKLIKWFLERTYIVDPQNRCYCVCGSGDLGGLIIRSIIYPILICVSLGFATPYVLMQLTEFFLTSYISHREIKISTMIGYKYMPQREHFVSSYMKTLVFTLFSCGFYGPQGIKELTNELLSLIEISAPIEE